MTIYALKVYQQLQIVVCKSKLLAIWSLLSRGIASLPDSKSLGSVLSAALCKIQANKHYTESLLDSAERRNCFSQRWKVHCMVAFWLYVCLPEVGHLCDICKLPTELMWIMTHISLTSSDGRNRLSFSTTTTFLGEAFSTERVRAPGPGPTSHTQLSLSWPASLTSRSEVDGLRKNNNCYQKIWCRRCHTGDIQVEQKVLAQLRPRC